MKPASFVLVCGLAATASLAAAQAPPMPPPPPPATSDAPSAPAPLTTGEPAVIIRSPTGAEVRGGDAPSSRWQADLERLDADLRLRLLAAKEPRTDWLAGELDAADIESQVRHFTAARTTAPNERLYLSSLGVACMQPTRPSLAPCEAVDRLADWARRDTDNGVPSLLLAGRARARGEADLAASFVEQAAAAPRFDDYWSQAAQHWWDYLRPLEVGVEPAAKAKAAEQYASMRELAWAAPLRALCAEPGQRVDRMRAACAALGQALAARGASFALRRAGARVAEINAANPPARAAAQAMHARILATTARCTQLQPDFAASLESPQAAVRARGVEQFAAWASAQAREGEVGACERVLAAAPR
jgi:hypothetical protein